MLESHAPSDRQVDLAIRSPALRRNGFWARRLARALGLAALAAYCWAGTAAADTRLASTAPTRIAVFDFELEDYSAVGKGGEENSALAPTTAEALTQSTAEARKQLLVPRRALADEEPHVGDAELTRRLRIPSD